MLTLYVYIYRMSIKSFPDYKHLLQENSERLFAHLCIYNNIQGESFPDYKHLLQENRERLFAHPVYIYITIYRVSIKSFPDYKHLLQENRERLFVHPVYTYNNIQGEHKVFP